MGLKSRQAKNAALGAIRPPGDNAGIRNWARYHRRKQLPPGVFFWPTPKVKNPERYLHASSRRRASAWRLIQWREHPAQMIAELFGVVLDSHSKRRNG